MSSSSAISVVVAYHDEPEAFLKECLDSLIHQTFEDWEGIVVNDAGNRELITRSGQPRGSATHSRPPSTNRGLGASRNTGIGATGSPLIALLDSDDRLEPEFLKKTLAALGESDWVAVDWRVFGERSGVLGVSGRRFCQLSRSLSIRGVRGAPHHFRLGRLAARRSPVHLARLWHRGRRRLRSSPDRARSASSPG